MSFSIFIFTWIYQKHTRKLLLNSGHRRCYHRIDIIFESEWGYYLYNEQARELMNATEAQLLFTFENRQTVAGSIASVCWCYGCRSIISFIFFIYFYVMCNSSIFLLFLPLNYFFIPSSTPICLNIAREEKNVQHQQKFVAVQNEVRMNHLFILRSILFLVKASKSVSKRYTEWVNRWGKIHQIARNSTAKNFIFTPLGMLKCNKALPCSIL